MKNYSLYCFDLMGSCVCRDSFDAENNVEARTIAGVICDACADEHHSYELWKGDLPIERGETSASMSDTAELSAKAHKIALSHMITLRNTAWPVSRSRRMRERIEAWALVTDNDSTIRGEHSQMRQFRRGVEFFVHSADDVHWTWLANLKTNWGERMHGTVNGTRAVAIKLCIAAIDEALSETIGRAHPPAQATLSEIPERVPSPAGLAKAQARQVLVAEDEAPFRDAAAELLNAAGFEVFRASDGEEALVILKEHPDISLLISDVRMPHMDGYALVEASLGLKPDLKVILMTGYANTPPKFVQDRNIDTLRKPFDLNVLRSRVENLTALH